MNENFPNNYELHNHKSKDIYAQYFENNCIALFKLFSINKRKFERYSHFIFHFTKEIKEKFRKDAKI